jgi:hypothetical protein
VSNNCNEQTVQTWRKQENRHWVWLEMPRSAVWTRP